MRKYLSFALLTLSICTINILPGQAATINLNINIKSNLLQGRWCVNFRNMGLLCLDL